MVAQFEDTVLQNNSWQGMSFVVTDNGELIDLSGASATMAFRKGGVEGEKVFILTSAAGNILLESPGNITILPENIQQPPDIYFGDLQLTFNTGVQETYIRVKLTIQPTTND